MGQKLWRPGHPELEESMIYITSRQLPLKNPGGKWKGRKCSKCTFTAVPTHQLCIHLAGPNDSPHYWLKTQLRIHCLKSKSLPAVWLWKDFKLYTVSAMLFVSHLCGPDSHALTFVFLCVATTFPQTI